MFLSLGIAFLIIIILVFTFQRRRANFKLQAIQNEQKLLRSQMNPHFVFNAITAIQSYIFTNSSREVVGYLSSFASLMRQILEGSRLDFVPLEDEINLLENYLKLQQLRYSNSFDFTIVVDQEINPESVKVPPMLNQPFIENAIEHGLKNITYRGVIELIIRKSGLFIEVSISDNGIGYKHNLKYSAKEHKSFAVDATKQRLSVIHKKNKTKLNFTIVDRKEIDPAQSGTIVSYSIPYLTIY